MATDAQGRMLSDDGNYYWDGDNWQLVDTGAGTGLQQSQTGQDAQGRLLSADGNYYWDGSNWQLVNSTTSSQQALSDSGAEVPGDIAMSMQDEVAAPDGEIALSELEPLPQHAVC
jgi:hypothetical protein